MAPSETEPPKSTYRSSGTNVFVSPRFFDQCLCGCITIFLMLSVLHVKNAVGIAACMCMCILVFVVYINTHTDF